MNKEFIQVTKGVLPVSVLSLLAIALIAGQAQVNAAPDSSAVMVKAAAENSYIDAHFLKSIESLPAEFESMITLPYELELSTLIPRGAINAEILTNRKISSH